MGIGKYLSRIFISKLIRISKSYVHIKIDRLTSSRVNNICLCWVKSTENNKNIERGIINFSFFEENDMLSIRVESFNMEINEEPIGDQRRLAEIFLKSLNRAQQADKKILMFIQ